MSTLFLPGFISTGGGGRGGGGRRRRRQETTPRERTLTVAASGALIPVLYGRVRVPGMVFAQGMIGSDFVIGYIWGVGEVQAIDALYINDKPVPGSGVTVTHYTGTPTQGVDPTLEAAITAYADTLRVDTPAGKRGIAYSVLRVQPSAEIGGFPAVQAVIRGRRVYDPRADETVYSDNTALCLGDLITDQDYGHGVPVYGLSEAADWCDALLGDTSEPRARISYAILAGSATESFIDAMAEQAECFWDYSGAGIRLIPDAPVDLSSVPTVGSGDIIKGSLTVEASSSLQAPTEVEVLYMAQTEDETGWQLLPAPPARLSGVKEGTVQRIPQSISMDGVYRAVEASNKALAYLNRQQHEVSVTWQTRDPGVLYQKGDVVKVIHPSRGVDLPVRIRGVALAGPGRYEVAGQRYDASHYPSEIVLPDVTGVVPVGAIVFLQGSTVPAGWDDYAAANGRYIIGAGGAHDVGNEGGGGAVSVSGSTTTNGAHGSGSGSIFVPVSGEASGTGSIATGFSSSNLGGHLHTVSHGPFTPAPTRRDTRLIIKTDTTALRFPASAMVFGLAGVASPDIERLTTNAHLLIRAAAEAGVVATVQAFAISTGSANDSHNHVQYSASSKSTGTLRTVRNTSGGGSHAHSGTMQVAVRAKRRRLALYGGVADFEVMPGMIVLWSGSLASLPADWALCDGANGTPDLRDHFMEAAQTGQEGAALGDNTIQATIGNLNSISHNHNGSAFQTALTRSAVGRHDTNVSHTHTFSATVAWTPPYYALAAIMFAPGG